MSEKKFFLCEQCGNIIEIVKKSGVPVFCCGKKMTEIVPNTVEASAEKHIPVVAVDGCTINVKVGSAAHPMVQEHHIEWIYIETVNGDQKKFLKVESLPESAFTVTEDDKVVAVYAYCNLHGLWKAEVN